MTALRMPDHQVAGDGDTTVFLLHGAYGSKDYFRSTIAALVRAGLRVVAWDAPGYGLSPLPAGGLRIEDMAAAAVRLIERTGTGTNVVVGHSMGGIVAPLVTRLLPERVHGLAISATVASFSQKSDDDKRIFLEERITPLKQGKPFREAAMPVIRSMFASGSKGERVDLVIETAASTANDTFIAAIEAIVNYEGVATLKQVTVPTLLIAGEADKVGRPEGMRAIKDKFIPHARYVCVANAGHYAFAEQPEAFEGALIPFVQEIAAARRGAKEAA